MTLANPPARLPMQTLLRFAAMVLACGGWLALPGCQDSPRDRNSEDRVVIDIDPSQVGGNGSGTTAVSEDEETTPESNEPAGDPSGDDPSSDDAPSEGSSSNQPLRGDSTEPSRKPAGGAAVRPVSAKGQWSGFRGPSGQGQTDARDLPLEWSNEEGIAWKTPLPGPGASSPAVFGERIYLTCYTGYYVPGESGGSLEELRRHLLAINRADGSVIWDKEFEARLPEESKIRDHGYTASTPTVDVDHVYVFFGKTGVLALDHDGNEKWRADVGDGTNGWGSAASPVLYKDLVFINAAVESGRLVALDRKTGEERWSADGMRDSWNTPVIVASLSGKDELVVVTMGEVRAYDPMGGDLIWTCKNDIGWYIVPSVVAHDGIVYSFGGRSGVVGIAVKTGGEGDVTESHRLWTTTAGTNVTSPVYRDGHLYFMNDARGTVHCLTAEHGDVVYEERAADGDQVYGSAVLAGDRVYYLTRSGVTYVIAANPKYELLATNNLSDRSIFNGSPVVDGNRLLIRSDKFLYCIGK